MGVVYLPGLEGVGLGDTVGPGLEFEVTHYA